MGKGGMAQGTRGKGINARDRAHRSAWNIFTIHKWLRRGTGKGD